MPEERLRYLLERYFTKVCTEKERRELSHLIVQARDDNNLKGLLEELWSNFTPSDTMPQEKSDLIIDTMLRAHTGPKIPVIVKTWKKITWQVAVAAIVVIMLSWGGYFIYLDHKANRPQITKASVDSAFGRKAKRAKLMLDDGRAVYLDSVLSGSIAMQGGVIVSKDANGQISYQGTNDKLIYNTLSNPRGSGVVSLMLSDGSKVWLNAGSTLKYPTAFIGTERKVEIIGEAYFEIAKKPNMPFYVRYRDVDIKVLGTHFNVNTFEDDDSNIKVTLLEGAVKINSGESKVLLKPGQQALVNKELKVVDNVNLDKVMAWKNGYFQFDGASLQSVLKQVSRWYDVQVIYQGQNRPRKFTGEIERDLNLSEILKFLEMYDVKFAIEGGQLIIKPD